MNMYSTMDDALSAHAIILLVTLEPPIEQSPCCLFLSGTDQCSACTVDNGTCSITHATLF